MVITWSEAELELLKKNYVVKSWKELEALFQRDKGAIRAKANRLGLTRGKDKGWTLGEEEFLKEVFETGEIKDLVNQFNRSWTAISAKARSIGLSRSDRWTEEELIYLQENYHSKSFEELEESLGRTTRAIKHAIFNHNLVCSKISKWTDKELDVLKSNQNLKTSELLKKLPDRSAVSISLKRRELFGTARRCIKENWRVKSEDLAYLLGVVCSDVCFNSAGMTLTVHPKDAEFADEFAKVAEKLFGLTSRKYVRTGSWEHKGEKNFGDYYVIGIYSVDLLPCFATKEGLDAGNVRVKGDWINFIDAGFSWVFENKYAPHFLGGLFDGDGSLSDKYCSFAIKPDKSKKKVLDFLKSKNFYKSTDGNSIYCNLSCLKYIKPRLSRKKGKSAGVEVKTISRSLAVEFLEKYHYLKTLPGSCTCYGYLENGELIGLAGVSSTKDEAGLSGLELRRFALKDLTSIVASKVLAKFIKKIKGSALNVHFIKTFADSNVNHTGTIYQAANFLYLGRTVPVTQYISNTGKVYSGRFFKKSMEKDGVGYSDCERQLVPGKHKYVYPFSEDAKNYFMNFAVEYPKSL